MTFAQGEPQPFRHGSSGRKRIGAHRKKSDDAKRPKAEAEPATSDDAYRSVHGNVDYPVPPRPGGSGDIPDCTNDAQECEGNPKTRVTTLSPRSRRLAIAYVYIHTMNAPGQQYWG